MLAIDESAKLLGVSIDTVRRRIKKGEIKAEKIPGPYGEQWFIPASEIQTAQEITSVIPVTRQLDLQQLTTVIESLVEKRNEHLIEEIKNLKNEIQLLNKELENRFEENERLAADRDKKLLADIRESLKEVKKPWWKFWE